VLRSPEPIARERDKPHLFGIRARKGYKRVLDLARRSRACQTGSSHGLGSDIEAAPDRPPPVSKTGFRFRGRGRPGGNGATSKDDAATISVLHEISIEAKKFPRVF